MNTSNAMEILVIEDNPQDLELTLRALRKANVTNQIQVARDGAEALDYVFCQGPYTHRRIEDIPKVVLLDLKLPKIDGLDVLKKIKQDPRTKSIPVVVLTTSRSEQDVLRSYELQANCYITKPVDLEQFITVVRSIEDFWFTIVRLPHAG